MANDFDLDLDLGAQVGETLRVAAAGSEREIAEYKRKTQQNALNIFRIEDAQRVASTKDHARDIERRAKELAGRSLPYEVASVTEGWAQGFLRESVGLNELGMMHDQTAFAFINEHSDMQEALKRSREIGNMSGIRKEVNNVLNFGSSMISQATSGGIALIPGLGKIPGASKAVRAASYLSFPLSTSVETYAELREKGFSEEFARTQGRIEGLTELAFMSLTAGIGRRIPGFGGLEGAFGRAVGLPANASKAVKLGAMGKFFTKRWSRPTRQAMQHAAGGVFGENVEELGTHVVTNLSRSLFVPGYEDAFNWTTPGKEGVDGLFDSPMMRGALETMWYTTATMGMLHGPTVTGNMLADWSENPSRRNTKAVRTILGKLGIDERGGTSKGRQRAKLLYNKLRSEGLSEETIMEISAANGVDMRIDTDLRYHDDGQLPSELQDLGAYEVPLGVVLDESVSESDAALAEQFERAVYDLNEDLGKKLGIDVKIVDTDRADGFVNEKGTTVKGLFSRPRGTPDSGGTIYISRDYLKRLVGGAYGKFEARDAVIGAYMHELHDGLQKSGHSAEFMRIIKDNLPEEFAVIRAQYARDFEEVTGQKLSDEDLDREAVSTLLQERIEAGDSGLLQQFLDEDLGLFARMRQFVYRSRAHREGDAFHDSMYDLIRKVAEINDIAPRLVINSRSGSEAIAGIVEGLGGEGGGKPREVDKVGETEAPAPKPRRKKKPGVTRAFDRIKNETVAESDERLSAVPTDGDVYVLTEDGEVVRGKLADRFLGSPTAKVRVDGIEGNVEKTKIVGAPPKPSPTTKKAGETAVEGLTEEEVALESEALGVEESALADALVEETVEEIDNAAEQRKADLESYDPDAAPVSETVPVPEDTPESTEQRVADELDAYVEEVSEGNNPPPIRARTAVEEEAEILEEGTVRKDEGEISTAPTDQARVLGEQIADEVKALGDEEGVDLEHLATAYSSTIGLTDEHDGGLVQPTLLELGLFQHLVRIGRLNAEEFVAARKVLYSRTIDPSYREVLNQMNSLELDHEILVRIVNADDRHRALKNPSDDAKREALLREAAQRAVMSRNVRERLQVEDSIAEGALSGGNYDGAWVAEIDNLRGKLLEMGFRENPKVLDIVGESVPLMRFIVDREFAPGEVVANEDGTITVPKAPAKRGPKPKKTPAELAVEALQTQADRVQSVLDRIMSGEVIPPEEIPTKEAVAEASRGRKEPLTDEQQALIESVQDEFLGENLDKTVNWAIREAGLAQTGVPVDRDAVASLINEALVAAAATFDPGRGMKFSSWVREQIKQRMKTLKRTEGKRNERKIQQLAGVLSGAKTVTAAQQEFLDSVEAEANKDLEDEENITDAIDVELSEEEAGTVVQSAQDMNERNREAEAQRELDRPRKKIIGIKAPLWLSDLIKEHGPMGQKVAGLIEDGRIPAEVAADPANRSEILHVLTKVLEEFEGAPVRAGVLRNHVERLMSNVPENERQEETEVIDEDIAAEENAVQEAVNEAVAAADDPPADVSEQSTDTPAEQRTRQKDQAKAFDVLDPEDINKLWYHPESGEYVVALMKDDVTDVWPEGMHKGRAVNFSSQLDEEGNPTGKQEATFREGTMWFPASELVEADIDKSDIIPVQRTMNDDEVRQAVEEAGARARQHHRDTTGLPFEEDKPQNWDVEDVKLAEKKIDEIKAEIESGTAEPSVEERDRILDLEAMVEIAKRAHKGDPPATLSVSKEGKKGRRDKTPLEIAGEFLDDAEVLSSAPDERVDNLRLQIETAVEGPELIWLRYSNRGALLDVLNSAWGMTGPFAKRIGRDRAIILSGLLTGEWPPGWAEVAERRAKNFSPSRVSSSVSQGAVSAASAASALRASMASRTGVDPGRRFHTMQVQKEWVDTAIGAVRRGVREKEWTWYLEEIPAIRSILEEVRVRRETKSREKQADYIEAEIERTGESNREVRLRIQEEELSKMSPKDLGYDELKYNIELTKASLTPGEIARTREAEARGRAQAIEDEQEELETKAETEARHQAERRAIREEWRSTEGRGQVLDALGLPPGAGQAEISAQLDLYDKLYNPGFIIVPSEEYIEEYYAGDPEGLAEHLKELNVRELPFGLEKFTQERALLRAAAREEYIDNLHRMGRTHFLLAAGESGVSVSMDVKAGSKEEKRLIGLYDPEGLAPKRKGGMSRGEVLKLVADPMRGGTQPPDLKLFDPDKALSVSKGALIGELEQYKTRIVETVEGTDYREVQITVVPSSGTVPIPDGPFALEEPDLDLLLDLLDDGFLEWRKWGGKAAPTPARMPAGAIGIAAKVSSPSGYSVADATQVAQAIQQVSMKRALQRGVIPDHLVPAATRIAEGLQSVDQVKDRIFYDGGKPQTLFDAVKIAREGEYTFEGYEDLEPLLGDAEKLVEKMADDDLDAQSAILVMAGSRPLSEDARKAQMKLAKEDASEELIRLKRAFPASDSNVLVNKKALREDAEMRAADLGHAHGNNNIGKNGVGYEPAVLEDLLRSVAGMRKTVESDGALQKTEEALWPELDPDSGEYSVDSDLVLRAIMASHLEEEGRELHEIVEDVILTYAFARQAESPEALRQILSRINTKSGRWLASKNGPTSEGGQLGHTLLRMAFTNLNKQTGGRVFDVAKKKKMRRTFEGKTMGQVRAVFRTDLPINSSPLYYKGSKSFETIFLALYGNHTVPVADPRGFSELDLQRMLGIDPAYEQAGGGLEGQEFHPLHGMIAQERPSEIYDTYQKMLVREATSILESKGGTSLSEQQAVSIGATKYEGILSQLGADTGRSEFENSLPELQVLIDAATKEYEGQPHATPYSYDDLLSGKRKAGRSRAPAGALRVTREEGAWKALSVGRGSSRRGRARGTKTKFNQRAQERAEVQRAQILSAKDRGEEDWRRRSDAEVREAGEAKLSREGARNIINDAVRVARRGTRAGFNDVDQVALTLAINQMTATEKENDVALVSLATAASLTIAGEFARGLRASGSVLTENEQRLRALNNAVFMPERKLHHRLEQLRKAGKNLEAERLQTDWSKGKGQFRGKGLPDLHRYLKSMGVDPFALNNLQNDAVAARRVLALADQHKADAMDGAFEFWRNSILGGVTTQMANIVGTVPYTLWEIGVKRNLEALVNLAVQDPDLPTFEENAVIFKHMIMNMGTAARYGWQAFKEEAPVVEARLGFEGRGRSKIEGMRTAIKGKKGKVIRTPQNVLLGVDEYMKYVISSGFAAGYALRASRKAINEGRLRPGDSAAFMEKLLQDKDRTIYTPAMNETLKMLWQQPLEKAGQHLVQIRDTIRPLRFLMPFIVTPANIFKTGVRMSPVGIGNLLWKGVQARSEGKSVSEAWKDLSPLAIEQVVSWMAIFALMGLGEDEEDGLPNITGASQEWEAGSRQASTREGMPPPFSVRMFGKWWSYERVEPFATVVGSLVDVAQGLKSGDPSKVAGNTVKGLYGQMYNKTFTRSFADMIDAAHSMQERGFLSGAGHWATNFASSWIPNYIRSTGRALQTEMPERGVWGDEEEMKDRTYDRLRAKTELGLVDNTPKVDIWGRTIARPRSPEWARQVHAPSSDFLYSLFVPVRNKSSDLFVGDRVILNWNNKNEGKQAKYPRAPRRNMKFNNKKRNLTDEQYHDYASLAGEIAKQLVSSANLEVDNPTQQDIDIITDSISRARTMARTILAPKFFGGGQIRTDVQIPQVAEEIRLEQLRSGARVLTQKPPSLKNLSADEKTLPIERRQVILQRLKDELGQKKADAASMLEQQGYNLKDILKAYGKGATGRRRIVKAVRGGS